MQTISTTETARKIGGVVLDVQREPIGITRRGEMVAVLVSATDYRAFACCCSEGDKPDILCPDHGFGSPDP